MDNRTKYEHPNFFVFKFILLFWRLRNSWLLEPSTEFDAWDGERWVTDKAAQQRAEAQAAQQAAKQELASRMTVANARIQPLQDAADLDIATEAEKAQLVAWKKYRVLLNRLDISTTPDIEWPELPLKKLGR